MSPTHPAMREPRTKEQRALALYNEPIGLSDVARLLGVSRLTPLKWRQRELMPEPVEGWRVSGDPVWRKLVALVWALRTGRLDGRAEQLSGLIDPLCDACTGPATKHRDKCRSEPLVQAVVDVQILRDKERARIASDRTLEAIDARNRARKKGA